MADRSELVTFLCNRHPIWLQYKEKFVIRNSLTIKFKLKKEKQVYIIKEEWNAKENA